VPKKANKLVQWQNIVDRGEAPPLFSFWMNDNEERLLGLISESVSTSDTHYGQEAALKERGLEALVNSMSQEKINELQQKLDECDIEDKEEATKAEQAQVTVSEDSMTGAVWISIHCYFNTHLSI
jgi:hypothetical protein